MNTVTEAPKTLKVCQSCDVAVAGGGIAGIAAALSAARAGVKTILIENGFLLGGLATAGLITIYLPLCDGEGHQVSFGICEELIKLSEKYGADIPIPRAWQKASSVKERAKKRYENRYHPNLFAVLCEQLLTEAGVQLLYGTRVCDVIKQGNKISHLIIENKGGRSAVAVKSVVDATGDADICAYSGVETAVFKAGNALASWYYFINEGRIKLRTLGYADHVDEDGTVTPSAENTICTTRYFGTDGKELSQMTEDMHKAFLNDFIKNGNATPEYSPVTVPTVPQIRMTRRMCGNFTLDTSHERRQFSSSVGMFSDWRKKGKVYELPFESLYSEAVPNLLTAGRCISVTDGMWDITRVIPVCAVSGEAAGIAAALSDNMSQLGCAPVQAELIKRGVPLHIDF